MANEPWKTNDWFVSEWNYAPDVTKDFKFSKNIKIHDVTLRDGEQQTGIMFTKDDKIRIAEALAEVGVHRVSVLGNSPRPTPEEIDDVREIARRNFMPPLCAFVKSPYEIEVAADEPVQHEGRGRREGLEEQRCRQELRQRGRNIRRESEGGHGYGSLWLGFRVRRSAVGHGGWAGKWPGGDGWVDDRGCARRVLPAVGDLLRENSSAPHAPPWRSENQTSWKSTSVHGRDHLIANPRGAGSRARTDAVGAARRALDDEAARVPHRA